MAMTRGATLKYFFPRIMRKRVILFWASCVIVAKSIDMELSEERTDLLHEVLRRRVSPDDPRFLAWLEASGEHQERYEREMARLAKEIWVARELDTKVLWGRVDKRIDTLTRSGKRFRIQVLKYAAAVVLPLLALGVYVFSDGGKEEIPYSIPVAGITPGGSNVILTLSDGKEIDLSGTFSPLQEINGTEITLQEQGQIVYEPREQQAAAVLFNTIQVPVKGEYGITLADGTKVWIAADSKLTFPVSFTGDKREIYLDGEAFFDVAPDKKKPFIVVCGNFSVRALGTSFNIMNYSNEESAQATLSTGKVEVTLKGDRQVLLPGQQAVISGDKMSVREVNLTPYISWMKDRFYFANEELQVILRKVARWYGVEVVYGTPEIMTHHFTGNIPKYKIGRAHV